MTQRDRHGIRRVIRLREVFETELALNHALDLDFGRRPETRHRHLHGAGIVFHDRDLFGRGRQENHTPRLGRRGDADRKFREKELFDRHDSRPIQLQQTGQFALNVEEPLRKGLRGGCFDRSKGHQSDGARSLFNDPPPGCGQPGIHAKDDAVTWRKLQ
jgi:hypothetical protein